MTQNKNCLIFRRDLLKLNSMKNIFLIAASLSLGILLTACSSQPKKSSQIMDDGQENSQELQKATPVKAGKVKVYSHPTQTAEEPDSSQNESAVVEKRGCETPLGTLAHGESATGYLKDIIQPDEVCISDTIRCKDGTWTGEAIHRTCKRADKK